MQSSDRAEAPSVEQTQRIHPKAKCEECPLFGRGVARSQFPTGECKGAIVSRSPGFHDTSAGRPFAGPSGQVLDHLLGLYGVKREEVYVSNVVLCSPPEGKVPPAAISACAPRLRAELNELSSPTILAAGAESVNLLIGGGPIDTYRGYVIQRGGTRYVATNNPALVLRDDSTFPNLVKDFKRAFDPTPPPEMPRVMLVEGIEDAKRVINDLAGQTGYVAADIESRGGLSHKASLVSLQLAFDGGLAYTFGERGGLWTDDDFIENYLRPFFSSTDRHFIWHNGIFDTKILRYGYGIEARVDEDTQLLSWALDERSGKDNEGSYHSLEYRLMEELAWPHYTPQSVKNFKKSGKLVSDTENTALKKKHKGNEAAYEAEYKKLEAKNYLALYKYAGYDAAGTFQLFELFSSRAKEEGVWDKPYKQTLLAAEDVLRTMEMTGMPYDFHKAAELLEKEVRPELDNITRKMQEITGHDILNPGSTKQMAVVYYDDFGAMHEMRFRPDKHRSTDESARKEIIDGRFNIRDETITVIEDGKVKMKPSPDAPIKKNNLQKIATLHDRYQKLNKQAGTYLESLITRAEADPESRIYTSLPRHATSTGRLASRGPNLQNVTRTKEGLPDIRGLFFAPPGKLLVSADYSQAELRAIGALSGDKLLCGYYERDEDLHSATASRFYGESFTQEQRSNSKNMNFGVFYWQSADTFQEKHEIPKEEAQTYIDWVWKTFTTVREWQNELVKQVHQNTYRNYSFIESPFGHRRRFYLITKENRNAIYREAINFLPQNIAANLTLHACIRLQREIDGARAKLCLTVHDSILAQVDESYTDEYSTICNEVMVSMPKEALGWTLPFKADIGVGTTWANAK